MPGPALPSWPHASAPWSAFCAATDPEAVACEQSGIDADGAFSTYTGVFAIVVFCGYQGHQALECSVVGAQPLLHTAVLVTLGVAVKQFMVYLKCVRHCRGVLPPFALADAVSISSMFRREKEGDLWHEGEW